MIDLKYVQITVGPSATTIPNVKELRIKVQGGADQVFTNSKLVHQDDFHSVFDLVLDEAIRQMREALKKNGLPTAPAIEQGG